MSAYKQLSEYFSDDMLKTASIVKELGTNHYIVRMKSEAGTWFSSSYECEEDAEKAAEDWVV